MEAEIGVHLVFRGGGNERIERFTELVRGRSVNVCRSQSCCLAFDSEPEVDHVEDVVVGADGCGLDGERRRLRHREHERASAMEGFHQAFRPQPRHRLADDRAGYAVLVDEFGLRGQLVAGRQVPGEDLVLQPGDHPLRESCCHDPNSALSFVNARIRSLSVNPSPGRSGTQIRPSRISMRSLKSGLSHSKCSTHGSVGYVAARCR